MINIPDLAHTMAFAEECHKDMERQQVKKEKGDNPKGGERGEIRYEPRTP